MPWKEWTVKLSASAQEVFEYITEPKYIKHWMPFISDSWADNTKSDSGPGVIRTIQSWDGGLTLEEVKFQTFPLYCYSCMKDTLGHFNHLGALVCVEGGDEQGRFLVSKFTNTPVTTLVWRTYAVMTSNSLMRWTGSTTFYYVIENSLNSLAKKWPCPQ
jgi:hypothetical protein